MYSKIYKYLLVFLLSGSYCKSIASPADSLFLTVDELFRLGVENSLKLQADKVQESMAHEQGKTARTSLLPDLQIELNGGVIGQPVVFQHGLSDATYPDTPDWSVGSVQDALLPFGSRFSRTCPQTVLACLHAYGSPLIT